MFPLVKNNFRGSPPASIGSINSNSGNRRSRSERQQPSSATPVLSSVKPTTDTSSDSSKLPSTSTKKSKASGDEGMRLNLNLQTYLLEHKHSVSFAGCRVTFDRAVNGMLSSDECKEISIVISRHKWLLKERQLNPLDEDHLEELFCFYSVKLGTWSTYENHCKNLKKSNLPINYDGLKKYFLRNHKKIGSGSFGTWISAVKLYLKATRQPGFTREQDEELNLIRRGMILDKSNKPQKAGKPVGDLQNEEVEIIRKDSETPQTTKDGITLQQAIGDRASRIGSLRHLQMKKVTANGKLLHYVFILPRNKVRADKMLGARRFERHESNPKWNTQLTSLYDKAALVYAQTPPERRHEDGALLVPGWKGPAESKHIKRIAEKNNWDPQLRWSSHSSKYGAAVNAAEAGVKEGLSAQGIHDKVKRSTGHSTARMINHYSRKREFKTGEFKRKGKPGYEWLDNIIGDVADQTLPTENEEAVVLRQHFNSQRRNKFR